MKLFDAIPDDLFSVLASPNRMLYSDALDVLCSAYRENLKISENKLYIFQNIGNVTSQETVIAQYYRIRAVGSIFAKALK